MEIMTLPETMRNNVRCNTKIHSEDRLDIHLFEPIAVCKEVALTVSTFNLEGAV
jgi:hypothetical protein